MRENKSAEPESSSILARREYIKGKIKQTRTCGNVEWVGRGVIMAEGGAGGGVVFCARKTVSPEDSYSRRANRDSDVAYVCDRLLR